MQPLKLALNFCIIIIVGWSEELAVDAWTNDRESACEKAGIATEEESLGSTSIVVHKVSRERRKRGRERERGMTLSFSCSVVSVMKRFLPGLESKCLVNTTSARLAGKCELHICSLVRTSTPL